MATKTANLRARPNGELSEVVPPRVEQHGPAMGEIAAIAGNKNEIVLNRGRREQGVNHGRRVAGLTFHPSGNSAPASNDRVFERQYSPRETRLQGVARGHVWHHVGVVGWQIENTLVVLAEGENADVEVALVDRAPIA